LGGALATLTGGNASNGIGSVGAGGGVAAGPAIFVNAGSVTTANSGAMGASATAGTAGSGISGSGTGGNADATPTFNYAGTVNGSTVPGPVPNALSNAAPQSAHASGKQSAEARYREKPLHSSRNR
jgi:hypothetical protein